MRKILSLFLLLAVLSSPLQARNSNRLGFAEPDLPYCAKAIEGLAEKLTKKSEVFFALGVVFSVTVFGIPIGGWFMYDSHRKETLSARSTALLSALNESNLSTEEAMAYRLDRLRAIHAIEVREQRQEDFTIINEERVAEGLQPLTHEDFEDEYPFEDDLREAVARSDKRYLLDDPMKEIAMRLARVGKTQISPSQVRTFLALHREDDYFCPGGKAFKLKRRHWKKYARDLIESIR